MKLGDQLLGPLLSAAAAALRGRQSPDVHVAETPSFALHHFADCLLASMDVNRDGRHAVAICLLRQCVEALGVIELGLLDTPDADQLIAR